MEMENTVQSQLGKKEEWQHTVLDSVMQDTKVFSYFSWNCRKPGLTCGLAFSREVVARGELAGRLGIEAGI